MKHLRVSYIKSTTIILAVLWIEVWTKIAENLQITILKVSFFIESHCISIPDITDVSPYGLKWKYIRIGSGNGQAHKMCGIQSPETLIMKLLTHILGRELCPWTLLCHRRSLDPFHLIDSHQSDYIWNRQFAQGVAVPQIDMDVPSYLWKIFHHEDHMVMALFWHSLVRWLLPLRRWSKQNAF